MTPYDSPLEECRLDDFMFPQVHWMILFSFDPGCQGRNTGALGVLQELAVLRGLNLEEFDVRVMATWTEEGHGKMPTASPSV